MNQTRPRHDCKNNEEQPVYGPLEEIAQQSTTQQWSVFYWSFTS